MSTAEKPKPWFSLLTPPNPDSKTGGLSIVIAFREYRSKYTTLECAGRSIPSSRFSGIPIVVVLSTTSWTSA